MTIYVDVFLFINMFETYLLLICLKFIFKLRLYQLRVIAASLVSSIISLSAFLPYDSFFIKLPITAVSSGAAVLIAFGYSGVRFFIKSACTLIILSILYSGSMIFLYLTLKPGGMIIINDKPYFNISPALLIILTVIIYFILYLYKKIFKNKCTAKLKHTIRFSYNNKEYITTVKEDSGCNLTEPFSGSRVIIIERNSVRFEDEIKDFRIIPFESLGGSGLIYGFKADEVYIDNIKSPQEIYIGLCNGIFTNEIKGLVPAELIGG